MTSALRSHWPEYLMEAAALGLFMISACTFTVLLEYPASLLHLAIPNPIERRVFMGIAMGLTAIAIICSPWGQRSGAHMNPSVTLTFFSLGKVQRWDTVFYILAQFAGGIAGVAIANLALGPAVRHSSVNYAATAPGPSGVAVAFWAEIAISFVMMSAVLLASNSKRFHRWTPFVAGALVATYITIEAPLSGMSMNPARTFGSALSAQQWTALWIYFTAPVIGMFAAAQLYRIRHGLELVFCAKFHHRNNQRCIFYCNYGALIK